MKLRTKFFVAALLTGMSLAGAASVSAIEPLNAFGNCGGFGYDYGTYYYNNDLENRMPYFALHPPVYYSYPVPRSYGYSPFAYPGTVRTPEVELTGKLEISNPYVPQKPEATVQPTTDVITAVPAVMINPFVEQPAAQLSSK